MYITIDKNRLILIRGKQTLWIEPWGENSLRVRMTGEASMDANDWAPIWNYIFLLDSSMDWE